VPQQFGAPQAQPAPTVRPPAATPPTTIRPGPNTRTYRMRTGDVPRSRYGRALRHHDYSRHGLSDFEKFGLIALGAAVVGSMLSNGNRVVYNYGDRMVYRDPYGGYGLYHDDDILIRRPGAQITTEVFPDGSVLTRVVEPDGTVITTLRNRYGRVLRRHVYYPDGRSYLLFDDTRALPAPQPAALPPRSPVDIVYSPATGPDLLRAAFETRPLQPPGRAFTLQQVRSIRQVRYLVPEVEIATLAFPSGSSAVLPEQARTLATLAHVMTDMIAQNPAEVFLIEGHSDAVGDPASNLALSDARAESAALALTEYFGVPPQNLITQGYGESDLKRPVSGPDPVNRRIIVRRITELLPQPAP
jgi:outer membrane protein OmpA-like peptidoglycan-associated protein